MNIKNLYERLNRSPLSTKIAVTAVLVAWGMFCVGPFANNFFFFSTERSDQTLEMISGTYTPVIALEPASGSVGATITVRGEGWPAGSLVLIYLKARDEMEILDYPIANAIADFEGRLTARFVFPRGSQWKNQERVAIIARTDDGRLPVQAIFDLGSSIKGYGPE